MYTYTLTWTHTHSVYLSLFYFLSLSLFLSLSFSLSLSFPLSPSLSLSLSLSLSPSLSLSLSLSLPLSAIDNSRLPPSFFNSFQSLLSLSKEHPASCCLGLQQCLDVAMFFSQHYMRKRVVARETLYSQIGWDYIPGLSHTLHLLCVALAYKWEESVSMGTATHQEGTVHV